MNRHARSCTRQEVEGSVMRSRYGASDLVPVIYAPEGKIVMVPRECVEMVLMVRKMTPAARAEFDKALHAIAGEAA